MSSRDRPHSTRSRVPSLSTRKQLPLLPLANVQTCTAQDHTRPGGFTGRTGRTNDLVIEVVAQLARAGGVAQLAQRLGLDLADPLAGDAELAADLLQRPLAAVLQPEAQLQHPPLAAGQRV